jgi:SAM-dependent methyltransferase
MVREAKQLTLSQKHEIERRFHDAKAATHQISTSRDFYNAGGANLVWNSYLTALGDIRGKTVLDFGCGEGWCTIEYARRGANVFSFDLSSRSIANLLKETERLRVSRSVHGTVMAAEFLGYTDAAFDMVLGWAILHHTDLRRVLPEILRVLKPGGSAFFVEPLAHNPFLRLFRFLTPKRRTPTERPLTIHQINEFARSFSTADFRGYHLFSIFPQGLLWATGSTFLFRWSLRITEVLDEFLLKALPSLQRYCWSALIKVTK